MKQTISKAHRIKYAAMLSNDSQYERILSALFSWPPLEYLLTSEDPSLNGVPLRLWDALGAALCDNQGSRIGPATMAGRVCLLKEAVRQVKDGTIERP